MVRQHNVHLQFLGHLVVVAQVEVVVAQEAVREEAVVVRQSLLPVGVMGMRLGGGDGVFGDFGGFPSGFGRG